MVFMMTSKQFPGDQETFVTEVLSKPPPPPPSSDCPRCGSINTKFCYYNNYNKSQPRYFCKSCKRHWTKGGNLRNIPAGRRRKNKRPLTSTTTTSAAAVAPSKNFQNFLTLSTDQKNMSNILYQALMDHSSSTTDCTILESNGTTSLYAPAPQHSINAGFTISNFNYQSSNDEYHVVIHAENLDSAEESTVTTGAAPPWTADVADFWSWNDEIDFFGSSANPYASWDNFEGHYKL